jgi:hypothetical protein
MHPLGVKITKVLVLKLLLIIALIYYLRPYKMKPTEAQVAERLLSSGAEGGR